MLAMVVFWTFGLYLAIVSGRRLRDSGVSLLDIGNKTVARWQEEGRLEREAQMKKSQE